MVSFMTLKNSMDERKYKKTIRHLISLYFYDFVCVVCVQGCLFSVTGIDKRDRERERMLH